MAAKLIARIPPVVYVPSHNAEPECELPSTRFIASHGRAIGISGSCPPSLRRIDRPRSLGAAAAAQVARRRRGGLERARGDRQRTAAAADPARAGRTGGAARAGRQRAGGAAARDEVRRPGAAAASRQESGQAGPAGRKEAGQQARHHEIGSQRQAGRGESRGRQEGAGRQEAGSGDSDRRSAGLCSACPAADLQRSAARAQHGDASHDHGTRRRPAACRPRRRA